MVWQTQSILIKTSRKKTQKRNSRFSEVRKQVEAGLRANINSCLNDTFGDKNYE